MNGDNTNNQLAVGLIHTYGKPFLWGSLILFATQLNHVLAHEHSEHLFLRLLLAPLLAGGIFAVGYYFLPGNAKAGLKRFADLMGRIEFWWFPVMVFGVLLYYVYGNLDARCDDPLNALLHAKWDVGHYKRILRLGYGHIKIDGVATTNACWLPALPMIGRGLDLVIRDFHWALLITAWGGALGAFYSLYGLSRHLFGVVAARWSLLALACFPTSFYLLIGFPYGLNLSFACLYALCVFKQRPVAAFFSGLALSLTYPSAVLAGLLPPAYYLPRIFSEKQFITMSRRMVLSGAGIAAGPLLMATYFWYSFGNFFAFWDCQARYERTWEWPWLVMEQALTARGFYDIYTAPFWLIVAAMAIFWHRLKPALWLLLLAMFLLSPSTGSIEATYRHYLVLWPLFILIGSSERPWWLKASFLVYELYVGAYHYLPLWIRDQLV